jgi:16S rRNA (adenine1518-N6/adenine1519-N6)-dimethyltransferase
MSDAAFVFEDPRAVLKRHGMKPKSSWGQNFLVSERAVKKIAAACQREDEPPHRVVEIGAGVGTLTQALLALGAHVISVERDRDMCRVLRKELAKADRFALLEADAAKLDYAAILGDTPGVVAGNLPYQLTGRLIRGILDNHHLLIRSVIMVQKEVAERLTAVPGASARGALSAITQARFSVRVMLRLRPTAFHPPPEVRSAVVALEPLAETPFDTGLSPATFDKIVNAAFSKRRKTIRNSLLSSDLGWSSREIDKRIALSEIDPKLRAERLSVDDFARLAATAKGQQ